MVSTKVIQKSTTILAKIRRFSYTCISNSSNTTTTIATTATAAENPDANADTHETPSVKLPEEKIKLNTNKDLPTLPLTDDITHDTPQSPSKPREPMKWIWQCHKCMRIWQMGVTQRCLNCSHRMCSGNPDKRRVCCTEFDFDGWRRWGEWKKDLKRCHYERGDQEEVDDDEIEFSLRPAKRRLFSVTPRYKKPSCLEDCVYPSHCYHEERQPIDTLSPIGEEEEEETDEGWYICDKNTVLDEEWYAEEDIDEEYDV